MFYSLSFPSAASGEIVIIFFLFHLNKTLLIHIQVFSISKTVCD